MRKLVSSLALLAALACLGASGEALAASASSEDEKPDTIEFPKIDRHPELADFERGALESLPRYDPASERPFQVDLRSRSLSKLDLRGSLNDLLYAAFDDKTVWPPDDRMPRGFDRQRIMELGKNPGLGARTLHMQGVTGRGVGVAIIDQPLATKHQEYADRLRLYEEITIRPDAEAQMHGPAVASIAVGKTVGVAPEADLYFIAASLRDRGSDEITYIYYAQAIRRILEINAQLPADRKIRVISMSRGWMSRDKTYDVIMAACEEATAAGMLVLCTGPDEVSGIDFHGMGRAPLSDPDDFELYEPSVPWTTASFEKHNPGCDSLLIPMDSRATAGPTGNDEYVYYRCGGKSWAVPYVAGVYALAAQVDPHITPERFGKLAVETGRTIQFRSDGKTFPMGPIIDPAAIIAALQNK